MISNDSQPLCSVEFYSWIANVLFAISCKSIDSFLWESADGDLLSVSIESKIFCAVLINYSWLMFTQFNFCGENATISTKNSGDYVDVLYGKIWKTRNQCES